MSAMGDDGWPVTGPVVPGKSHPGRDGKGIAHLWRIFIINDVSSARAEVGGLVDRARKELRLAFLDPWSLGDEIAAILVKRPVCDKVADWLGADECRFDRRWGRLSDGRWRGYDALGEHPWGSRRGRGRWRLGRGRKRAKTHHSRDD
jgi:hypothetical protein